MLVLKSTRSDAIPVSAVKAPKDRSLEKVRTDRKSTVKPIKRNTANLCIKGQNCGVTCISRTKTCRTTLRDMSASGRASSDRISAYFKELGRKSQLKPTPKPRSKPRTKPIVKPQKLRVIDAVSGYGTAQTPGNKIPRFRVVDEQGNVINAFHRKKEAEFFLTRQKRSDSMTRSDAKPKKPSNPKVCTIGQGCGTGCISKKKTCRLSAQNLSASGQAASDRVASAITKDLDISNLFGDISQLPKRGVTRFTTEEDIFDLAPLVKQRFDNILNRGRGVSKSLGASEVDMSDVNADFNKAIETDGKVVILGNLKRRERAREKVFADYKGEDNPWGNIKDIVRSTVAVTKIDEIPLAITAIEQEMASKGFKLLQQPKNHFANPLETGYRDINLVYVSPSGFATEVQVNTKEMLKAKNVAHTQYEELRTIDEKAKQNPLTPQEVERRKELIKQSRAIYDPAYLRSF